MIKLFVAFSRIIDPIPVPFSGNTDNYLISICPTNGNPYALLVGDRAFYGLGAGIAVDIKSVFEILIRENTDMLLAYLRSAVRDEHAIDDLYQEIFLTAWKRLEVYDRQRPFGPWLRGIASRVVLAYYRKTARTDLPIDGAALEWLDGRFEAIQSRMGDTFEEKLLALRECISELPESYRAPVTLRYFKQQTIPQVAAALQLTRESLKKRFARSKTRLADCLDRKLNISEASR